MTKPNNVGPAFPTETTHTHYPGMSLRDYFAGQALAGLLADHTIDMPEEFIARSSYWFADAMLRERE